MLAKLFHSAVFHSEHTGTKYNDINMLYMCVKKVKITFDSVSYLSS